VGEVESGLVQGECQVRFIISVVQCQNTVVSSFI
jgi:hypothetical protein